MRSKTNLILLLTTLALMAGCFEREIDCKDPFNKEAAQCKKHESMNEHSTGNSNNPKKW